MPSAISELLQLLPPPPTPYGTDVDWTVVESGLGLTLPSDYKEFIEHYGSVRICHVMFVLHPTVPTTNWKADTVQLLQETIDGIPGGRDNVRYPSYPSSGGLFPIVRIMDDLFCWITKGDCENWRLLYWSNWGIEVREFSQSLTEFLVDVLSLRSDLVPNNIPLNWFGFESPYRQVEPYIPPEQFQPPEEYYRKKPRET